MKYLFFKELGVFPDFGKWGTENFLPLKASWSTRPVESNRRNDTVCPNPTWASALITSEGGTLVRRLKIFFNTHPIQTPYTIVPMHSELAQTTTISNIARSALRAPPASKDEYRRRCAFTFAIRTSILANSTSAPSIEIRRENFGGSWNKPSIPKMYWWQMRNSSLTIQNACFPDGKPIKCSAARQGKGNSQLLDESVRPRITTQATISANITIMRKIRQIRDTRLSFCQ